MSRLKVLLAVRRRVVALRRIQLKGSGWRISSQECKKRILCVRGLTYLQLLDVGLERDELFQKFYVGGELRVLV